MSYEPFTTITFGEPIDEKVYRLRDRYGLPGMRVLQFSFGKDIGNSLHAIHNHTFNSIAYTGTHDNNTAKGWYRYETRRLQRKNLDICAGKKVNMDNCHKELIRLAYSSVAKTVIIPLQDILGLGSSARMNTPAVAAGNWTWRLGRDQHNHPDWKWIRDLVRTFGRY